MEVEDGWNTSDRSSVSPEVSHYSSIKLLTLANGITFAALSTILVALHTLSSKVLPWHVELR